MAHEPAHFEFQRLTGVRTLAILAASLMLSACAGTGDLLPPSPYLASNDTQADTPADPNAELRKATDYWGKEYASKPADRTAALSYAKNLKAMGDKRQALNVLQTAGAIHGRDPEVAGELGRLALEFDQLGMASKALELADVPERPDWKVISARGTVLAKQGQHKAAIPFFERALALSPNQPSVLNNLAMANAMSGNAQKAEEILRGIATKDGVPAKVNQNLALVLGLQGKYDEAKLAGSSGGAGDVAAENTDYVRRMVRLEPKAAPAQPQPTSTAAAAAAAATQPGSTVANLPWKPAAAAPVANAPAATSAGAAKVARASDAFKPATVENTSAASSWQTAITANAQNTDSSSLKGSRR